MFCFANSANIATLVAQKYVLKTISKIIQLTIDEGDPHERYL